MGLYQHIAEFGTHSILRNATGRHPKLKRAVLLDRDGTINRDRGFVHRVADLELLDHCVAGLAKMSQLGFELVITTNQSGIARGYFTEAQMHEFNAALCDRLRAEGVTIAAIYYCPFHPTEGIGPYLRESRLRKPDCGMLITAAAQRGLDLAASFAVGDKASDIEAGRAAGCRTILLRSRESEALPVDVRPDFVVTDLLEAASAIQRLCVPAIEAA
jgi:D-glycero-D-manno-heptose 1,7-bisphosphate phosphatase